MHASKWSCSCSNNPAAYIGSIADFVRFLPAHHELEGDKRSKNVENADNAPLKQDRETVLYGRFV
jgi:hypothetical protein